jgi:hypothetical protein
MKTIHVFENSYELFQDGGDFGRGGENYRNVKGTFPKLSAAVFQNFGASCPSTGSGRDETLDCS